MMKVNAQKLMEPILDSTKYPTGMQESSNIRTALNLILTSLILNRNLNRMMTIRTRMVMTRLKLMDKLIQLRHTQGGTIQVTYHRQDYGRNAVMRNETFEQYAKNVREHNIYVLPSDLIYHVK
jgi:hypothetical protein